MVIVELAIVTVGARHVIVCQSSSGSSERWGSVVCARTVAIATAIAHLLILGEHLRMLRLLLLLLLELIVSIL